jgi:hypothetical protein
MFNFNLIIPTSLPVAEQIAISVLQKRLLSSGVCVDVCLSDCVSVRPDGYFNSQKRLKARAGEGSAVDETTGAKAPLVLPAKSPSDFSRKVAIKPWQFKDLPLNKTFLNLSGLDCNHDKYLFFHRRQ